MLTANTDMITLKPASTSRSTAQAAPLRMEIQQIAYAINNAANCGQVTVTYTHPISADARAQLESNGYKIYNTDNSSLGRDEISKEFMISWKEE